VELRRRILVFFDGVPAVVRKQVPEPQGQAGGQAGDFPVLRGGEIGGEKLLLGVFVENLHQVCHNQKTPPKHANCTYS